MLYNKLNKKRSVKGGETMALIKRKKGKINGAVYDNTVYHNGERRFYLPVYELYGLLQKIAEANETTEFLRLIPHYLYKKMERRGGQRLKILRKGARVCVRENIS